MTLIKNVSVNGQIRDVRVSTTITELSAELTANDDEEVVDGVGGELLPGFHDHHLHFLALAASFESVHCGPPAVTTRAQMFNAIQSAPGQGWVRGVGYHESIADDLDRWLLDQIVSDRPVRIQHRSGKMWVLNSRGCELLALDGEVGRDGIELNHKGVPTGRLFRLDGWLRERLQGDQSFHRLSRHLASLGITSFTDASFTNGLATLIDFNAARAQGALLQKFDLMGDESLESGYHKIMLDEDALPVIDDLVAVIIKAGEQGRGVAFHCVSHIELLFALTGLKTAVKAGLKTAHPARIEHASIVREEMIEQLLDCHASVVTQPGFLLHRGDQYIADLRSDELQDLYRLATLKRRGVPVLVSSDAPYGPVCPLTVATAAATRATSSREVIGEVERVSALDALRSYFVTNVHDLASVRTVEIGQPGDLCILNGTLSGSLNGSMSDRPVDQVVPSLAHLQVTHTLIDGRVVYSRD